MGSGNFRDISYICLQQDILVTSQGFISPVSFFCFRRRSLVGGTVPGSKTDSCLCGVFVPGKRFIWNKMTLGRVPPAKDRPNKEHSNNVPRPMCSRSTPLAQCAPSQCLLSAVCHAVPVIILQGLCKKCGKCPWNRIK